MLKKEKRIENLLKERRYAKDASFGM
jgi:hypothetical protein